MLDRVKAAPDEIFERDGSGKTPFHVFCSRFRCDAGDPTSSHVALEVVERFMTASYRPLATELDRQRAVSWSSLLAQDDFGEIPLHSLCGRGNSSPMVLKKIFEFCAEEGRHERSVPSPLDLISMKNLRGCTPLHFVSDSKVLDSTRIMLGYCNALDDTNHPLMIQDEDGDTPLHYACSGGESLEVIEIMLKHCPFLALVPNEDGETPICDLWTWYKDDLEYELGSYEEQEIAKHHLLPKFISPAQHKPLESVLLQKFWEMFQILLKAAYHRSVVLPTHKIFKPLHAAAGSNFPIFTLYVALYMKYSHLLLRDEDGMIPLHVACCNPLGKDEHEKITHLLALSPNSTKIRTKENRLAFHLAVEHQKELCFLRELLKMTPEVLNVRDPKTKLYPFMLAAVHHNNGLNVVFELLSWNPTLVHSNRA